MKKIVKVDAYSTASPVNRYLVRVNFIKYGDRLFYRNKRRYQKVLYTKTYYNIQWHTLKNDLLGLFFSEWSLRYALGAFSLVVYLKTGNPLYLLGMGVVAFDATSNADNSATAVTSLSWSHTCTGSDRVLISSVSFYSAGIADWAATYNSVSMTSVRNRNGGASGTAFRLTGPATGSNTIQHTWTTSAKCVGGAISVTGSDGTVDGLASDDRDGATDPSVAVTSAVNNLVVDFMWSGAGAARTVTVGAGQTERVNLFVAVTAPDYLGLAMSHEAGAASVTMSWSFDTSSNFSQNGVNIVAGSQATSAPHWLLMGI